MRASREREKEVCLKLGKIGYRLLWSLSNQAYLVLENLPDTYARVRGVKNTIEEVEQWAEDQR